MQLTPRYGHDPVIVIEGSRSEILAPVLRQARRLLVELAELTKEQWMMTSRCADWSNRDVVLHLASVADFWCLAIDAGLRGRPTTLLSSFDPVLTPAQIVRGSGDVPPAEALSRHAASIETLGHLLESLDEDQWARLAETPVGHVPISVLAHHALWDGWVHERDVLVNIGTTPPIERDEVEASLRYVIALGAALAITGGDTRTGSLGVTTTNPAITFHVDIGQHVVVRGQGDMPDLQLDGDAVELLEALSLRAPLTTRIPSEHAWMLTGLATAFEDASTVSD